MALETRVRLNWENLDEGIKLLQGRIKQSTDGLEEGMAEAIEAAAKRMGVLQERLEDSSDALDLKSAQDQMNQILKTAIKVGDSLEGYGAKTVVEQDLKPLQKGFVNTAEAADHMAHSTQNAQKRLRGVGLGGQNVLRVIQDMQFGMFGVANNIEQVSESFAHLQKQTGSAKETMRAMLMPLVSGPMAIATITTVTVALVSSWDSLVAGFKDFRSTVRGATGEQKQFNAALRETAKQAADIRREFAKTNLFQMTGSLQAAIEGIDASPGGTRFSVGSGAAAGGLQAPGSTLGRLTGRQQRLRGIFEELLGGASQGAAIRLRYAQTVEALREAYPDTYQQFIPDLLDAFDLAPDDDGGGGGGEGLDFPLGNPQLGAGVVRPPRDVIGDFPGLPDFGTGPGISATPLRQAAQLDIARRTASMQGMSTNTLQGVGEREAAQMAILDRREALQQSLFDSGLTNERQYNTQLAQIQGERISAERQAEERRNQIREQAAARRRQLLQQELGYYQQTAQGVSGFLQAIAQTEDEQSRKSLERRKTLLYTAAIADTIGASVSIWSKVLSQPGTPAPLALASAAASQAAVLAQGYARAEEIRDLSLGDGPPGSGGGSITGEFTTLNSEVTNARTRNFAQAQRERSMMANGMGGDPFLGELRKTRQAIQDQKVTYDDKTAADINERGSNRNNDLRYGAT